MCKVVKNDLVREKKYTKAEIHLENTDSKKFNRSQVIYNDIKLVNGTLLNYARKSPGKVLTGDLNSFTALYGGSPTFSNDLTKGGYKLDQERLTLEKIS